jgi:hypothetical protein
VNETGGRGVWPPVPALGEVDPPLADPPVLDPPAPDPPVLDPPVVELGDPSTEAVSAEVASPAAVPEALGSAGVPPPQPATTAPNTAATRTLRGSKVGAVNACSLGVRRIR